MSSFGNVTGSTAGRPEAAVCEEPAPAAGAAGASPAGPMCRTAPADRARSLATSSVVADSALDTVAPYCGGDETSPVTGGAGVVRYASRFAEALKDGDKVTLNLDVKATVELGGRVTEKVEIKRKGDEFVVLVKGSAEFLGDVKFLTASMGVPGKVELKARTPAEAGQLAAAYVATLEGHGALTQSGRRALKELAAHVSAVELGLAQTATAELEPGGPGDLWARAKAGTETSGRWELGGKEGPALVTINKFGFSTEASAGRSPLGSFHIDGIAVEAKFEAKSEHTTPLARPFAGSRDKIEIELELNGGPARTLKAGGAKLTGVAGGVQKVKMEIEISMAKAQNCGAMDALQRGDVGEALSRLEGSAHVKLEHEQKLKIEGKGKAGASLHGVGVEVKGGASFERRVGDLHTVEGTPAEVRAKLKEIVLASVGL